MRALILTSVALAACGPSTPPGGACKESLIAGDLVITEIFADYSGPDEGKEWFEIVNASDRPLDLKGLTIVHNRPDDSKEPKTHVIGDLTINHTGDDHEWFTRALGDVAATERGFFWFDERLEHGYAA